MFLTYGWAFYGFCDLWDYIALPRYMGSKSLCGLGGSLGVDRFLGKPKFWCGFILSIVMLFFFFLLGMDDLWIS